MRPRVFWIENEAVTASRSVCARVKPTFSATDGQQLALRKKKESQVWTTCQQHNTTMKYYPQYNNFVTWPAMLILPAVYVVVAVLASRSVTPASRYCRQTTQKRPPSL